MWVPLTEAPPAAPPAAAPASVAPGPLAAFAAVHRQLKENEKKLISFGGDLEQIMFTIDEKVSQASRRVEQDGRRLRAETSDMCADLEELCLQIYEEHEAALAEERSTNDKLRAALESEQAAHRAALTAQQGQIDALAAALKRQQDLLDEHIRGTDTQMKATQAETSELHRAFRAQGAAVQATKAYIGSVDEKLTAQLSEQARAADAAATAATTSWNTRHAEHRAILERLLAWEPQIRANEEAMRGWRIGVDEAILRSEQRGTAAVQAAQTILDGGRLEMAEAVGKALASVRELEQRWPEWVAELREQQTTLSVRKANAAEVNERLEEMEMQLGSLTRQMTHSMPGMNERLVRLEEPRKQLAAQMEEVARALAKASNELAEMRAALRHSKAQLGTLSAERQTHATALASLETRLRQVGSITEEQARYLVTLSDALQEKGVSAPKYRVSYISQARVAPSMLPDALLPTCAHACSSEDTGLAGGRPASATVRRAPATGGLGAGFELGGVQTPAPAFRAYDAESASETTNDELGAGHI